MAKFITEPSRTFSEYLLLPNLTTRDCVTANVNLTTPLVKFKKGSKPEFELGIPFVSAAMQSVSGETMARELGVLGGVAFVFCSQPPESQATMIANIKKKRGSDNYVIGAAVNTHDYKERIPLLVQAGAEVLCIDSSDGFSEWQSDVIAFVRKNYGEKIKIGAGNVVCEEGFRYLANAGADFVKVGIGGGAICITREQKGIGRGQASALIDVVAARDKYLKEKGIYIPICSDGGFVFDNHIIIALAMGMDFAMMGRYFAGFAESPSAIVTKDGKKYKEYWGEGSARANNWRRYGGDKMKFEEGVDSLIPFKGKLADGLDVSLNKIKSTMCNLGSLNLESFVKNARLTVVSQASLVEGGAHNVTVK
ncbi:MAG: IMP dehydrogenase [Firmicutes bacterium]|nr:IMP dehydrogenase [Bacillota bacterium]